MLSRLSMPMSTPTSRSLEDPAADAARLLLRLGLGVLAFGLPVLALLSRRAVFIVFPLAAVLVLLAAMLRGPQASFRHFGAAVTSRLGLAMLFIVGWTALSLTWTPFLAEASDHLLKILGTGLLSVAVVSALPEHTRSSDLNLVPIGVTLGALLALVLAFQVIPAASAEPDTVTLPRGLAGLAVVVWPALGALGARQHWGLAGLLMLGVAAAAALLWSPVVLLALGCGAIAFVAARGDLRPVTRGLGLGAALLFVAAPVLPLLADTLFAARGMEASELARSAAAWAAIIKADSPAC